MKVADGQSILAGTIILRQRGTKFHPGLNVRRANDDSLFSIADGIVNFVKKVEIENSLTSWLKIKKAPVGAFLFKGNSYD